MKCQSVQNGNHLKTPEKNFSNVTASQLVATSAIHSSIHPSINQSVRFARLSLMAKFVGFFAIDMQFMRNVDIYRLTFWTLCTHIIWFVVLLKAHEKRPEV